MSADEKMFHIGLWAFGAVLMLTIGLQVCYRTQNRARNRVRAEIVQTQQEIAVKTADFSSYVRLESLRNLVDVIYPRAEVISFHKSITVSELPDRE